jgi:hypothetical protein
MQLRSGKNTAFVSKPIPIPSNCINFKHHMELRSGKKLDYSLTKERKPDVFDSDTMNIKCFVNTIHKRLDLMLALNELGFNKKKINNNVNLTELYNDKIRLAREIYYLLDYYYEDYTVKYKTFLDTTRNKAFELINQTLFYLNSNCVNCKFTVKEDRLSAYALIDELRQYLKKK